MYYVKESNLRDLVHFSLQKCLVEISYTVNYFIIKYQIFYSCKVEEGQADLSTSPVTRATLVLLHSNEKQQEQISTLFCYSAA